jgi:MerR family transcriptional regulator, mercuric resistance operon regulatory protein
MRIGEVAAEAGVNIQTLRYYERRGLLAAPERTGSGYRRYPGDTVRVVRFIKRAQELGFSLRECQELLGLASGEAGGCGAVRRLATRKIADLEARIAALRGMRRSLERLVQTCDGPRARRECPLLEAIG